MWVLDLSLLLTALGKSLAPPYPPVSAITSKMHPFLFVLFFSELGRAWGRDQIVFHRVVPLFSVSLWWVSWSSSLEESPLVKNEFAKS